MGEFKADLWVDDAVIVELKIARDYQPAVDSVVETGSKPPESRLASSSTSGAKVEYRRFVF